MATTLAQSAHSCLRVATVMMTWCDPACMRYSSSCYACLFSRVVMLESTFVQLSAFKHWHVVTRDKSVLETW